MFPKGSTRYSTSTVLLLQLHTARGGPWLSLLTLTGYTERERHVKCIYIIRSTPTGNLRVIRYRYEARNLAFCIILPCRVVLCLWRVRVHSAGIRKGKSKRRPTATGHQPVPRKSFCARSSRGTAHDYGRTTRPSWAWITCRPTSI